MIRVYRGVFCAGRSSEDLALTEDQIKNVWLTNEWDK